MDGCPSDADLNSYLSGQDLAEVGVHLLQCEPCQKSAERLSDDEGLRLLSLANGESRWDWSGAGDLATIVDALCNPAVIGRKLERTLAPTAFTFEAAESPGSLRRLGPYDLEEEIGRGGMGAVFRARDRTTGRVVALKVLFAGSDDERTRRRFVQEVRAAAKVEHDHIVRLYATSDPAERIPYFVMEYLGGNSLGGEIALRGRIPPREAAELVSQAATGLHAAHASGLIHSDVKPANILLDPATNRAKVADFGLARLRAEPENLSREGILAGTPAYLSPEQVKGNGEPDPRTDIYSLGVTLYECLAGEPPFRGEPHRIIQQVLNDEPRPPRIFNDAVPRDLETICLKAMAKEPSRRYASALDFSADLQRFLKREPILARPAGSVERLWRWCRNNRRTASLTAVAALLLIALAVGSTVASIWIYKERAKAISEANRADLQAASAEVQRGVTLDALTSLIDGIQDQLATRPGTLELRRSLLETARAGLRRVAHEQSAQPSVVANWSTVQAAIRLGDIDLILGHADEAQAEFAEAAKLAERVSSADPKSVPLRRELANAYDRLGDQSGRAYLYIDSNPHYEKAYAIRTALLAENPESAAVRRDVRISQTKLGNFLTANIFDEEKRKKGRSYYEAALKSLKAEVAEVVDDANRVQVLSDLRYLNGRLGNVVAYEGNASEALARMRESLANAQALCALDPQNANYLRQRAFAWDYLGTACTRYNDWTGAETALRAFRDDRQAASKADPADQDSQRSLALAHKHLGELAGKRRDFETARQEFHESLKMFEELTKRDPKSVMAYKDYLLAMRVLFDLEALAMRPDEAVRWLDRELEAQQAKSVPPHPDQPGWIEEAKFLREIYRNVGKVIDDPSFARTQPPKIAAALIKVRAVYLARSARDAEADETAREVLALPKEFRAPDVAARAYAISASLLDASQAEKKTRYSKAAVEALREAIAASPRLAHFLAFDPDFSALRENQDFIALTRR